MNISTELKVMKAAPLDTILTQVADILSEGRGRDPINALHISLPEFPVFKLIWRRSTPVAQATTPPSAEKTISLTMDQIGTILDPIQFAAESAEENARDLQAHEPGKTEEILGHYTYAQDLRSVLISIAEQSGDCHATTT